MQNKAMDSEGEVWRRAMATVFNGFEGEEGVSMGGLNAYHRYVDLPLPLTYLPLLYASDFIR